MSDVPTGPNLPTPDDTIGSTEKLARFASELTDHEVGEIGKIMANLVSKYGARRNTVENLDELRDEALTRLAEINVLATVDPAPCFYGEPPIVEIIGKVPTDPVHKAGFDHERKGWEVNEANKRNEDWRGQKEQHKG